MSHSETPDNSDADSLRRRWQSLPQASNAGNSSAVFEGILEKYGEKHRRYHTVSHLVELFSLFDLHETVVKDGESVQLAIFFHDIVYDIPGPDNEEKSALRALRDLKTAGFSDRTAQRVAALVRMTKTHECPPGDFDAALFLDMDMAILGSPEKDYERYRQGIQAEYAPFYGIEAYSSGRLHRFLIPALKRERLFLTDIFEKRCGAQARTNIRAEIDWLQPPGIGSDIRPGL